MPLPITNDYKKVINTYSTCTYYNNNIIKLPEIKGEINYE